MWAYHAQAQTDMTQTHKMNTIIPRHVIVSDVCNDLK